VVCLETFKLMGSEQLPHKEKKSHIYTITKIKESNQFAIGTNKGFYFIKISENIFSIMVAF
jgi:hypothetical protein